MESDSPRGGERMWGVTGWEGGGGGGEVVEGRSGLVSTYSPPSVRGIRQGGDGGRRLIVLTV